MRGGAGACACFNRSVAQEMEPKPTRRQGGGARSRPEGRRRRSRPVNKEAEPGADRRGGGGAADRRQGEARRRRRAGGCGRLLRWLLASYRCTKPGGP